MIDILSKTFVWMTVGLTFASFVLGGLTWWVPTFLKYANMSKNLDDDMYDVVQYNYKCLLRNFV